jgi:Na+-translocating ferredoxin:NAD+ oxidoreductase RnfG subunit
MKVQFLLLPAAAALVTAVPAHAEVYLSVEQAQQLMFPGATFEPAPVTLTDDQAAAIEKQTDTNVRNKKLQVWKVSTGGWFIADEVVGKHEFIPLGIGLDAAGAVKDVEILEYREAYGDAVRGPEWRAQFSGKRNGDKIVLEETVRNISGATLSSKHITDGVRRILATYALVIAPH